MADSLNNELPPLITATHSEDIQQVRQVLEQEKGDFNVNNPRNEDGETALHRACKYGLVDIARLLIGRGADTNAQDNYGFTPLHSICVTDPFIMLMIMLGFNGHQDGPITNRHLQIMELLLANGSNIDARDNEGKTPLHHLCMGRVRLPLLRWLIQHGANIQTQDNRGGFTPLHDATFHGHWNVMNLLISHGASLNATDTNGITPLQTAYIGLYMARQDLHHTVETMRLLIRNGASVNAADSRGFSLLHNTILGLYQNGVDLDNSLAVMKLLIQNGANVNATDNQGTTPLQMSVACQRVLQNERGVNAKRSVMPMELLLQNDDININATDNDGNSPLHLAAEWNLFEATVCLLQHGADRNMPTTNGERMTPLHVACKNGSIGPVWVLLAWSPVPAATTTIQSWGPAATVHATNREGKTALHLACEENHLDVVSFLVRQYPNVVLPSSS